MVWPAAGSEPVSTAGTGGHSSRPTYDAWVTTGGPKKRSRSNRGVQAQTSISPPDASRRITGHETDIQDSSSSLSGWPGLRQSGDRPASTVAGWDRQRNGSSAP